MSYLSDLEPHDTFSSRFCVEFISVLKLFINNYDIFKKNDNYKINKKNKKKYCKWNKNLKILPTVKKGNVSPKKI